MTLEKVAAIVVTFNRKLLLCECIDSLLRQSRPVDQIYVIDNASSDGTEELIGARGYVTNGCVKYVRLSENSGGAGGFFEGLRCAIGSDCDRFWVMDDDAEPADDALEKLAAQFSYEAVTPMVVRPNGSTDFGHRGMVNRSASENLVLPLQPSAANEGILEIEFSSFVGLCISRRIVESIGLPKREFFIHGDDNEYCIRILKHTKIVLVPQSKILHKEAQTATLADKKWLGRRSSRLEYDKLWLRYYGLRNLTWLRIQMHGRRGLLVSAKVLLREMTRCILYDDHKASRLRFWVCSFVDGMRGNFDNAKPRRLLYGAQKQ